MQSRCRQQLTLLDHKSAANCGIGRKVWKFINCCRSKGHVPSCVKDGECNEPIGQLQNYKPFKALGRGFRLIMPTRVEKYWPQEGERSERPRVLQPILITYTYNLYLLRPFISKLFVTRTYTYILYL
jgi:hypothetical protein